MEVDVLKKTWKRGEKKTKMKKYEHEKRRRLFSVHVWVWWRKSRKALCYTSMSSGNAIIELSFSVNKVDVIELYIDVQKRFWKSIHEIFFEWERFWWVVIPFAWKSISIFATTENPLLNKQVMRFHELLWIIQFCNFRSIVYYFLSKPLNPCKFFIKSTIRMCQHLTGSISNMNDIFHQSLLC